VDRSIPINGLTDIFKGLGSIPFSKKHPNKGYHDAMKLAISIRFYGCYFNILECPALSAGQEFGEFWIFQYLVEELGKAVIQNFFSFYFFRNP